VAGFFSEATLEQIRAASDIVDVIGSYIPLKKSGANFQALCPFHKEKTPSFNVNPHLQIFKCFGCQKGGNVFTFVKEYEGLDFPETVRRLADRAKIPLEFEQGPGEQQARHIKEKLLQIHEQITQRWQHALANEAAGQIARDYLAKRGVSTEAITLFRLGYAPEVWDDTVNWGKNKGHEPTVMEKAGLILRKEGSESYYDRFRGRLMFPICDEQGRVIGFSGRILSGDEKTAKYVNSPETPIFTKSKVFFGLDKSKRALLQAECAVVCEGQLDLIACYMAGVQNIVAPQGTAFTAEHARILKRYVEEVVLCFDSDEAGQSAAVRSLEHLLASGLAVRVAVVPAPHDPDSFVKEFGSEAFKQLIEQAAGFFDYYLNRLCTVHDPSTDRGRLTILRDMAEAVHKTSNAVLIDNYARQTALRLGASPEAVRVEFKKLIPKLARAAQETASEMPAVPQVQPPSVQEHSLLTLLLRCEELAATACEQIDVEWLQHPYVRQLVARRLEAHKAGTWQSLAALLGEFPEPEIQALMTQAAMDQRPISNPPQQLSDVARELRDQYFERQLAMLMQRIRNPETAELERLELFKQRAELQAKKRQGLKAAAT
jgi:DNA primase